MFDAAKEPGLAMEHLIHFFKALHESNAHMAIVVISNPQELVQVYVSTW